MYDAVGLIKKTFTRLTEERRGEQVLNLPFSKVLRQYKTKDNVEYCLMSQGVVAENNIFTSEYLFELQNKLQM